MPDLIQLAIPAFLLLLIVEVVCDAVMRRELYEVKDTAASLTMGIGNVLIGIATKGIAFVVFTAVHRLAIFRIGHQWWAWLLLFAADDFTYYWFHRTSHQCRLFWASHVIHHSSQRYNLATALRQTWTGGFMTFIFWLWLPLIGFAPMMVLTMQAISLLYQFWIHTELIRSMGAVDAVLNTPSHHRVHHASNPRYIDRNHAGTLIIWDRLFGTFEPEDLKECPVYGLTKNINSYNPLRIAFHEWQDMWNDLRHTTTWRERWECVFGSPGRKYEKEAKASAASTSV
jgi:sterol desaturase/sphingolipid hydroxylase (fatty acid hydroxylase superfamily)